MSDSSEILSTLRKQVAKNRKALEEQEAALLVLEQMLGSGHFSDITEGSANPAQETSVINLNDLNVQGASKRKGLTEHVTGLQGRFGEQEFNCAHVQAILTQSGDAPGGKSPRARISMVLSKLEKSGLIERTFQGKGNVPNMYKFKTNENEV